MRIDSSTFTNWQMQFPRSEAMVAPSTGSSPAREPSPIRAAKVDVARESSKASSPDPSPAEPTTEEDPQATDRQQEVATTAAAQAAAPKETKNDATALTADEQREVQRLKHRDAEVRRHEAAHAAAGGAHAGAPHYDFETGPDGRRYAVAGRVSISLADVPGNPEASARKLEQVVRAALAPAEPSGADRAVATSARARLARLRAEKLRDVTAESRTTLQSKDTEQLSSPSGDPQTRGLESPGDSRQSRPLQTNRSGPNTLRSNTDDPMAPGVQVSSALGSGGNAQLGSRGDGSIQRAMDEYQKVESPALSSSRLNLLSCANCGGLHSR